MVLPKEYLRVHEAATAKAAPLLGNFEHLQFTLRRQRAQREEVLNADIQCVWHANWRSTGRADKVWLQLNREGVRTTTADTSRPYPLDHVHRQFKASWPNELWVSDFTYISTWQGWPVSPAYRTASPMPG